MKLQAVIFDVDGTRADTEEAHRQAFNDAFKESGLPWHWDVELYGELLAVAGGKERLRHYCRSVDSAGLGIAVLSLPSPLAGWSTPGFPARQDSPKPTSQEHTWPLPPKVKRKSCATTTSNAGRWALSPANSILIATV